jgi:hypothetical protein
VSWHIVTHIKAAPCGSKPRELCAHLLRGQYKRLFEIQQIQIELLEELTRKGEKAPPPRAP